MIRRWFATLMLYIATGGLQALLGDDGDYSMIEVVRDSNCGTYMAILRSDIGAVRRVASGPTKDTAIRNLIDKLIAQKGVL